MPVYRQTEQVFRIAQQETLAATHRLIVDTAKREHARVMGTPPRPQSFTRTVDGVKGAREEAVKPNGYINYRYPRIDLVIQGAFLALIDKSPFLSGEYIRGHTLFMGGIAVLSGEAGMVPNQSASWFQSWRPGTELVIANFVPYSRKIELGKMNMRVPGTDEVYFRAQQIISRKYGNIANIRFTWRGVVPGHNQGLTRRRKKNKYGGDDNRWPALVITEK